MRMRTIVTAVVLSAGCVLGGSAQAMANDLGSDNDGHVSGCGIIAGASGGSGETHAYYAEGCLKIDRGDKGGDSGHDDGRNWGHHDESRDQGYAGMQDPLHLGGAQG
jgi:hypothetical protein